MGCQMTVPIATAHRPGLGLGPLFSDLGTYTVFRQPCLSRVNNNTATCILVLRTDSEQTQCIVQPIGHPVDLAMRIIELPQSRGNNAGSDVSDNLIRSNWDCS